MTASCGANSAVSKTWVPSVTRLSPTPSANSAVTSGRPIATTEPKVISRITIAASSPIAKEESCSSSARASSIGWPPSSTWRPSPAAAWPIAMTFLPSPSTSLSLITSNWTVA